MPFESTVTTRCIPRKYSFVPKGNVYITANCRKSTQEADQKVYVVISPDKHKKIIGIAVPKHIHDDVSAREAQTRSQRAAAVDKRDASIKTQFEKAILQEYPRIPAESLAKVLKIALEKKSGKVGRTGTMNIEMKARLAVRAHIRHYHTLYDTQLRTMKMSKEMARDAVKDQVNALAVAWGKAPGTARRAKTQHRKPTKAVAKTLAVTAKSTTKTSAHAGNHRMTKVIAKGKHSEALAASLDKAGGNDTAKKRALKTTIQNRGDNPPRRFIP